MLALLLLTSSLYAQAAQIVETGPFVELRKPAPVPIEQLADPFAKDLFWNGMGTAADLGSTSASLHFCPTCTERNPLGWDVEARISLKLATGIAAGATCYALRRSHHPRGATILRWTVFGIQALAATNNTIHAIRGR